MSYSSNFNLNQRVSYLESLINSLIPPFPTSSTLAQVLVNGNSAGASDINMNSKDLLLVDNINLVTINGSAYPPVVGSDTLQQVVNTGNGISNFVAPNVANITSTNFTNNRQLLLNANADPTIKMIDNLNSAHFTTLDLDSIAMTGAGTISATGGLTLPSVVAFTNAIAPTCLANPQGSTDLCNKQYVDSQSALTAYQLYFNYSVPYTVPSGATYSSLSSTQVATPTTVAWATSGITPVFLGGFFNLLSTLNITSISAGVWTLLLFANLTSLSGQGREAFFYTIIGTASSGAETILYTSPASLLLNTVAPLIGSVSIQGTIPLISLTGYTGLGIKLYIQANSATATTGSVVYQTPSAYSSILTSVLPISAVSNLSLVLTAGNSAGASSINMNNNNITSILQASGQAVLLTNTTANTTLTVGSSSATTTTLLTKFNNGRTAQTGEAIRLDFNAKNSAGTEFNYGKIHINTPAVGAGVERGRMDFDVRDGAGLSTYLNCNGSTQQLNSFKPLYMNSQSISGITTATTVNGYTLAPQSVNFLTGDSATPGAKDNNMRLVYCNTSVADSLEAVTGTFPSTWGNILCSTTWSSAYQTAVWVGTNTGRLFWTTDNGVNWNLPFTGEVKMDGEIRCLAVFNGQLWFGGSFTQELTSFIPANYIAYLDNNENFIQALWNGFLLGSNGFNSPVNTMVEYGSILYIGGEFTADNSGLLGTEKLCSVDTGLILYDTDGQTFGFSTNGFSGGNITQIIINNAYPDNMAVCGSFSTFTSTFFGSLSCPYFCIWRFSGNASNNTAVYPTFTGGITLDNNSLTVMTNGGIFYVGGNFSNTLEPSSFSGSPYFFTVDIASYNQIDNPYNYISSAPITKMVLPPSSGIYWADLNGGLYFNGNYLVNAPFVSTWSWIGDVTYGGYFSTISSSQIPTTMYYWKTSDVINIVLNNPLISPTGTTYTGNIILNAKGSTIELVWNATNNDWYVLSIQGGVGYN